MDRCHNGLRVSSTAGIPWLAQQAALAYSRIADTFEGVGPASAALATWFLLPTLDALVATSMSVYWRDFA